MTKEVLQKIKKPKGLLSIDKNEKGDIDLCWNAIVLLR